MNLNRNSKNQRKRKHLFFDDFYILHKPIVFFLILLSVGYFRCVIA